MSAEAGKVEIAGGKVQVASGVRGNVKFAQRQDLLACLDAKLYQLVDPEDSSKLCVDGITANSFIPDPRIPECKWQFSNAGLYDPSTAARVSAAGIVPAVQDGDGNMSCTFQSRPASAKPSPAQSALEDLSAAELAGAGVVQQGATYPVVGRNAPMRMSRTPVFFDATRSDAPQMLAKYFYAMHKRWGGQDNFPCCGSSKSSCEPPEDRKEIDASGCVLTDQPTCGVPPKSWWNGGVRKENIYFADREASPSLGSEQVLCLRFQGDQAVVGTSELANGGNSGIPALGRTVELSKSDAATYYPGTYKLADEERDNTTYNLTPGCETCRVYPVDAKNAKRVGSVLASANNYASGLYEVYARLPPGNKQEVDGMGYVFAMWTFYYAEVYPLYANPRYKADGSVPPGAITDESRKSKDVYQHSYKFDPAQQGMKGNYVSGVAAMEHLESVGNNRFSCGLFSHNCDQTANWCEPTSRGAPSCVLNDGPMTVHNHEIDIEIPSNACRLPKVNLAKAAEKGGRPPVPEEGVCGWRSNTINFNSWLSDDQDYRDGSPYRNNGVRRMDGKGFIATKKNDFHWYGIEWITGDDATQKPPGIYFYFDRKLVHRISNTYVPSRAGHLNIGPWFGWWGGQANYGAKEVLIKYINIVPYAAVNDPFNATPVPSGGVDVSKLSALWSVGSDGSPSVASTSSMPALPPLTASQLSELYQTVAKTQTDSHVTPLALTASRIEASKNDINAPQMYDQCGRSKLRNVCDFNEFLVDGVSSGVPSGTIKSGKVLAAIEPRKCPRIQTECNKFKVVNGEIQTAKYLAPTLPRHKYFDTSVDPDPDMDDNVVEAYSISQFPSDADGGPAVLCGDPSATQYCKAASSNAVSLAAAPKPRSTGRKLPVFGIALIVVFCLLVACVVSALAMRARKHALSRQKS